MFSIEKARLTALHYEKFVSDYISDFEEGLYNLYDLSSKHLGLCVSGSLSVCLGVCVENKETN